MNFYARRIKRLLPALLFCVIITFFLAAILLHPTLNTLRTGIASLFGLSNLVLIKISQSYFNEGGNSNLFLHTWSLGVEEQFYFFFPFLFIFFPAWKTRYLRYQQVLLGTSIFSFSAWLYFSLNSPNLAFFFSPLRFWEFSAGCLAFLARAPKNSNTDLYMRFTHAALLGLGACCLVPSNYAIISRPIVVILSAYLLWAIKNTKNTPSYLKSSTLIYIGLLSYSLYLFHWPVIALAQLTIGVSLKTSPILLVVIVALSLVSYYLIEKPVRHTKITDKNTIRVATFCTVSLSILIYSQTDLLARTISIAEYPPAFSTQLNPSIWDINNCDFSQTRSFSDGDNFSWDLCRIQLLDKKNSQRVFLIGDSYAQQLVPAIKKLHFKNAYAVSASGCPLWQAQTSTGKNKYCNLFSEFFLKKILEQIAPGDIVIAANSFAYLGQKKSVLLNHKPLSRDQHLQLTIEFYNNLGKKIQANGGYLYVTSNIPVLANDPLTCLSPWDKYKDSCSESTRVLPATNRKKVSMALKNQGEVTGHFKYIDLYSEITRAAQVFPLNKLYYNKSHLSQKGSEIIADGFALQLSNANTPKNVVPKI